MSVELMTHVLQMFPLEGLNLIPQRGHKIVTYFDFKSLIVDVYSGLMEAVSPV